MKFKLDVLHGKRTVELKPDMFYFSNLELDILRRFRNEDGAIDCEKFSYHYSWLNEKIIHLMESEAVKSA